MKHRYAIAAIAVATACSGADVEPVGNPGPVETEAPTAPSRETTRMTVQQLAASVTVVAGDDITWSVGPYDNVFVNLGRTLGAPDYTRVTEEAAIPDALYVKFMNDMALNICGQMRDVEPSERTLTKFISVDETKDSDAIYENLRYLHLRFFGERVAAEDKAPVEDLKALFDIAVAESTSGSAALDGWQAVCVAMLRAPAFHVY